MMVMVSNNSSQLTKSLAKAYPGKIGWLQGPTYWKQPQDNIPYALDNDAFIAWSNNHPWDESKWFSMINRVAQLARPPLWALVPDEVSNREATLVKWFRYYPIVHELGVMTAFAVQNGMTPSDVPKEADLVFVGGTTTWKWHTAAMWCKEFPRVHIGRVRKTKLLRCVQLGAESCDGSGWFRDSQNGNPAQYLKAYVEGFIRPHPELF